MKNNIDIKVKVEYTEGYAGRYTRACLKKLEQRHRRQQKGPPGKKDDFLQQKELA